MDHRSEHRWILLVSFVLAGLCPGARAQSDGELDPTFWSDGRAAFDGQIYDSVTATLLAPDGRLVVVGNRQDPSGEGTAFWATLGDDSLEPPCVSAIPGDGAYFAPQAAGFDPEGRLVIAGAAYLETISGQGFALRYLYPACDLDESFNTDGVYRTNFVPYDWVQFEGVAFDSNSSVVLAGNLFPLDWIGESRPFVVRLAHTGLLDWNFGDFGIVQFEPDEFGYFKAIAVQPDDKVVLGGTFYDFDFDHRFQVVRLDSTGDLDETFAGNGSVRYNFQFEQYERATALAIDPVRGTILAAGYSGEGEDARLELVRLLPNGLPDGSFDDDGFWTDTEPYGGWGAAVQLQSDGKILVGGYADHPGTTESDFVAHRLLPNGDADDSFGSSGVTSVSFDLDPCLDDYLLAATLHSGKLVVAGFARDSSPLEERAVVARLWSDLIFTDGFERASAGAWSSAVDAP